MTYDRMHSYLKPLKSAFEAAANPERAEQQKAYMKGQYAYYGLTSPIRKQLIQAHQVEHDLLPEDSRVEIVKWCWEQPQREWQYFAMEMLGRVAKKEGKDICDLYEYLIVNKSWWDTIDYIAVNLVGPYFTKYPEKIETVTSKWMASGNIWLQRSCLLFQLKYKDKLNTELLESFIYPLITSKEFFIRKAIGWILREYSKTNADYVISFVNNIELSGLSHREALKWLNRS